MRQEVRGFAVFVIHAPIHHSTLPNLHMLKWLPRFIETGRRESLHPSFINSLVSIFERHLAMSDPSQRTPIYRIAPPFDHSNGSGGLSLQALLRSFSSSAPKSGCDSTCGCHACGHSKWRGNPRCHGRYPACGNRGAGGLHCRQPSFISIVLSSIQFRLTPTSVTIGAIRTVV